MNTNTPTNTLTPNPFNPAALRLKVELGGVGGVQKLLTRVPVRKPGKQDWFRVHPDADYRMDMGVIFVEEDDKAAYAVSGDLQEELADLMVPITLYTLITRQGTLMLWPVRVPTLDGKVHDAWTSAHEIAEMATKNWVRMQWNPSLGAYDAFTATGIRDEPKWPDTKFDALLEIGFKGRIISKPDHVVIGKLRGEA